MSFANKSSQPLVGVDVSSTSVKVLQLSKSGDRYRVEHYAVETLPPGAVLEKNIIDVEAVGEAIKRAMSRSGSKAKRAAAAVAGSSVITKVISMPGDLDEDEMEAQIELEAPGNIPYPIDEVSMDFEVLGPTPGIPTSVQVLLAASRTETVDTRVQALRAAGLTPSVIDVEAFALENAFALVTDQLPIGNSGIIALIDSGATMTTLNVLKEGRSIYAREQNFGGKQLTEEVMRRYGLNYDDAGVAKRQGGLPETYENEVLNPFKESMSQQVSRLLQFFYAGTEYHRVDQLVLAGGNAAIPGIAQLIEEQTGIPTIVANPMARMTLGTRVQALSIAQDAPALMIAVGLALRSFD